jgi:sulfite reductase (ferredoxin)
MTDETIETSEPVGKLSPADKKPSPVEKAKVESNFLRGTIPEELADGNPMFSKPNVQLLKHHGTYQQDDREARTHREGGGKSVKSFMFMVRSRVPGGKLTSDQLLGELDLADELGNGSLRITSRQGLQLHGILKGELHKTIQRINEIKLSTLAACGDVERNVMCCPAPHHHDPVHAEMQQLADRIAQHLAPRTTAYHDIWLRDPETGEDHLVGGSRNRDPAGANGHNHATKPEAAKSDVEPIYGPTYLPRKFKTGIALCGDNCIDVYANDLGLLAICRDFKIIGYNVLVGGGMGVVPSAAKTFPAVAKRMAFVRPDQVLDVATAIVKVQRDFGNRSDRKVARLKYTIHSMGLAQFKAKVEQYYGQPLPDPHPDDVTGFDDHLGWHEQGDGRWFYGLNIENGRIHDIDGWQLKTALREICRKCRPGVRLTANQSLLFTDIAEGDRSGVEEILRQHTVKALHEISNVRRWSMACVAWPTCGLAITEAERALPSMLDHLEVELAKIGLSGDVFTLRMTGCPNGCARPYNCDIGLVGRALDRYTVYVGGRSLGDRLSFIYKDMVASSDVVRTLMPLFVYFKQSRHPGETFGDFCLRKGPTDLLEWTTSFSLQKLNTWSAVGGAGI